MSVKNGAALYSRQLVSEFGPCQLYHYQATQSDSTGKPLLIVFATINRPDVLDLLPSYSLIGELLKRHRDIYLLDWGHPPVSLMDISFACYVTDYLTHAVSMVLEKSQHLTLDLLGICQGGLICLCYAALKKTLHQLVLISTPIHFHTHDNTVAKLISHLDLDKIATAKTNISGQWIRHFFTLLKPFELSGKKYLILSDKIKDKVWVDKFMRVEQWLLDSPDQPPKAFSEFLRFFYHENRLIEGGLCFDGEAVDLKSIAIPILNVMARDDHIVPVSASRGLNKWINSKNYKQKIIQGGHIGIYLKKKSVVSLAKTIHDWLN
ncbi:MAG: hypothetical protein A3E85_02935 [Gammaproteobacteria bacterium RIFCSPHIGHO2_12_FULL_45_12]|nr:MAG: hypothetical protein A3E85_02935 [Gammaproteobacteria bacterium RIFCSPHIGHO2_12_FULL_45_12]